MGDPKIFISCGQQAEKHLGQQIAQIAAATTGQGSFFAQDVHDLNGLDTNILNALRDCLGFIAVLHPRGEITRPDGTRIIRASVWIEQEIAIAAYISRIEKREIPIIVFKHSSIELEGLRSLLHVNPIEFTSDSDVLAALPLRLAQWSLQKAAISSLELTSAVRPREQGHPIRCATLTFFNTSNNRITQYNGTLSAPADPLTHWSSHYPSEVKDANQRDRRIVRFDEEGRGPILPHEKKVMFTLDYCTKCAVDKSVEPGAAIAESKFEGTVWIDGREHTVTKTIRQMAEEARR